MFPPERKTLRGVELARIRKFKRRDQETSTSDSGFRERAVASQRMQGRRDEFSSAETKARAFRWKPAPELEFK